ncbi:MAG: adenosylhomocysteinase [Clostridia bacterium]|nr:adenosylhomocysteinase [Clostridia bacterium]
MSRSIIRDQSLAAKGKRKIDWVKRHMPLLNGIKDEFSKHKPLKDLKVSVSIHLEAKTAYLAQVLAAGGAQVYITGSNPLSTQDDIAAALVQHGINVFAWYGASEKEYIEHLNYTLECKPHIVIDDGGDLVHMLHGERKDLADHVMGGCEETTTGVMRLKARQRGEGLNFPMMAVNDAYCKYLFDNRYGTGQSVWDGIMRTTNLIVAGKTVVVAGYGWCGKGVALKAKGLGANVIVCEVDPIKALEAFMDGYRVMSMDKAAKQGDIFITVTGCNQVITARHFDNMKDGAILANAGHFNVEISVDDLETCCVEKREMRDNITGYVMKDGRIINLLAEGRLVNLAAGDGHPAEIMDMSFALQALCAEYIVKNGQGLKNVLYKVPDEIDKRVAEMKLASLGVEIDYLDPGQIEYINGWGGKYA